MEPAELRTSVTGNRMLIVSHGPNEPERKGCRRRKEEERWVAGDEIDDRGTHRTIDVQSLDPHVLTVVGRGERATHGAP